MQLPALSGILDDRLRLSQLRGATTDGYLLRSPSSLATPLGDSGGIHLLIPGRWTVLLPSVTFAQNSTVPFSLNDGAFWAGRGASASISAGFRYEIGPLRIAIAPQLVYAANDSFTLYDTTRFYTPFRIPPYRSVYSPRWNIFPNSIDAPLRFGNEQLRYGDPGESSLSVTAGPVRFGASTENEWWGPGIENALLLSNNASGVPRLFVRSARPLGTPIGQFDFDWFVGRLDESPFFRVPGADTTQDAYEHLGTTHRSLVAAALTWQPPREPDLTLGIARAVYAPLIYRTPLPLRWLDVFKDVGQPNDRPPDDTTAVLGRDQLFSLFGRWVFPADGFEAYFEWIRATLPVSIRDFLVDPSHSRGYTVGLQWLSSANRWGAAMRIQGEVTNLEKDPSFRDRPLGSIYTSRVVPQGYTQRGQPLGAAIGQGASSQWLAADYVAPLWSLGVFGTRIRWNDDAHTITPYPDYKGWCEHDVSLISGVRGQWLSHFGILGASFSGGPRYNLFYQNPGGCPLTPGQVDIWYTTFRISFEPLGVWRRKD
jgi:hypothetical protein